MVALPSHAIQPFHTFWTPGFTRRFALFAFIIDGHQLSLEHLKLKHRRILAIFGNIKVVGAVKF